MKKTAFLFLIFIILLSFSLRAYSLMEPINKLNPVDILVEIEPGMSGRAIADLLEEEGAIKSSTIFYLLLRFKEVNNLRAGYYRFSTSNTPQEIIEKLQRGEEERFRVTIPEGFTYQQILNRFSALEIPELERKILDQYLQEFVSELEIDKYLEQFDSYGDYYLNPAEGIIIPDTYNFPLSADERIIAGELIEKFKSQRLPKIKEAAINSDYTAYEYLIIASLIEEEGKLTEENKKIASVIYNRLDIGMPLQLDATIQYALPERTNRVLYRDLEIESPYNTYRVDRLPPTPIASPGDLALEAALNPAETDYLFYFTPAGGDGSHIFTRSYEEHLQRQREFN